MTDGVERAAILLLGMGEENAANVMKYLEPRQVQKLGMKMSTLSSVSESMLQEIIRDFLSEIKQQASFGVDSEEYVKKVLHDALGPEQAESFLNRILATEQQDGLYKLKWLEPRSVADLIRNEHPQVIATILTNLDSEQAAEVLTFLSTDRKVEVLMRMCSIDTIKPEAMTALNQVIEGQLEGLKQGKVTTSGGVSAVADVINYLDSSIETQVLEKIGEVDPDLSDKIQEKMFVFENLADVDGRSIQTILREVSTENLLFALKGATERVKNKIFSNMSKRAAGLLADDLEAQGPLKVSEVETAQKEILAVARKLAETGEINLGGKGEEMI